MKKIFLFLSLMIFASVVRADIPQPSKTPPPQQKQEARVYFNIGVSSYYSEPTLVVPRNMLKDLQAQINEIEGKDSNSASLSGVSRTQTLMSGLFFSAALIFGGVWVFRGKSLGKNQKIVAGLLIFAFLGASVYTVSANVAPPKYQNINSSMFSDPMKNTRRMARGKVKIEVIDDTAKTETIQLFVPRNDGETNKNDEE